MKINKKIITILIFVIMTIFSQISYADSNDTSLKSLSIEPSNYELVQDESDKNIYRVKVDNSITSIQVKAVPNNNNAKVAISGNENLAVGTNKVTIEVSAPNAETSKYTIYVRRTSPSLVQEQIIPNVQEGYNEVTPEVKPDTVEPTVVNNEIENTSTNEVNYRVPQTNTTNITNTVQNNKTQPSSNKIGIIIGIIVFLLLIVLLTRKPKHKRKH